MLESRGCDCIFVSLSLGNNHAMMKVIFWIIADFYSNERRLPKSKEWGTRCDSKLVAVWHLAFLDEKSSFKLAVYAL